MFITNGVMMISAHSCYIGVDIIFILCNSDRRILKFTLNKQESYKRIKAKLSIAIALETMYI